MTKSRQRTETDFLALTISAGAGREELQQHDATRRPAKNFRYVVTVKSDATGVTIRFDYHDSIDRHDRGIDQLDREALLYAFWSFVRDAECGEMTFDEFAGEMGYDADSYSARRTWTGCRAALAKFGRLFHDPARFTTSYVLEQLAHEGIE